MNDWGIKKFLKVVLAIQLALWGAIGLGAMGLQIPILNKIKLLRFISQGVSV